MAQNDFEAGDGGLALHYLDECQWNLRGWEHRYLWTRINARQTLAGHADLVWSAAFSADGKRILTGSWDKTAKVWDAATGQETPHSQGTQLLGAECRVQPRRQTHRHRRWRVWLSRHTTNERSKGLGRRDGPAALCHQRAPKPGVERRVQPRRQTHRLRQPGRKGERVGRRDGPGTPRPQM